MLHARYALEPFVLLQKEMDKLLQDTALGATVRRHASNTDGLSTSYYPSFNVWEKDDVYWIEVECPGLSKGDFEISVIGNEITLSGERRSTMSEDVSYYRRECGVGKFSRTLSLPSDINQDAVVATLKDGLLTIQLPKVQSATPKKILIQ